MSNGTMERRPSAPRESGTTIRPLRPGITRRRVETTWKERAQSALTTGDTIRPLTRTAETLEVRVPTAAPRVREREREQRLNAYARLLLLWGWWPVMAGGVITACAIVQLVRAIL